ncbi:hypothetical protein L7F22_047950, partial [Adiantum nelumboides]|nr:hypothetical protein [Adiantum nelumboides]
LTCGEAGPAAISTSVWQGARLCDVLRRCGVIRKRFSQHQGLYVCFEVADQVVQPAGLRYGMMPFQELSVAEWLNGSLASMLHIVNPTATTMSKATDFFPPMLQMLRRRMLKVNIEILNLHLYYRADWWHKPDYRINELNVSPAHGEVVQITVQTPYIVHGDAYS